MRPHQLHRPLTLLFSIQKKLPQVQVGVCPLLAQPPLVIASIPHEINRLITMAAEGGYSKIVVIAGEAQAEYSGIMMDRDALSIPAPPIRLVIRDTVLRIHQTDHGKEVEGAMEEGVIMLVPHHETITSASGEII